MRGGEMTIGGRQISREAVAAAAATLLFIALSIWWLLYDNRTPGGGDPAIHLSTALQIADFLRNADIGAIADVGYNVDTARFYPPLVPLVGSTAPLLGLAVHDWGTVALNLVFVPMLVAGCYIAGKRIYSPVAGMLAAIFALGTPMVLSLFHVFLLDAPLAGSVAITFAALIASERFAVRRFSIAAGALLGMAVMVKPIAPLYLLGPVLVMLVAGGWRQWRNVSLGLLGAVIVAGPYCAIHIGEILDVGRDTTVSSEIGATGTAFDRDPRISFDNLAYYARASINQQYYVPLLALFAAGFVVAVRSVRSRPGIAELLAGAFVSYFTLAIGLGFRDPRYSLPLIVFVAIIATGWITRVSRSWVRRGGLLVLASAVTLNLAAAVVNWIPDLRISPGATTVTFVAGRGYWGGAPQPNPLWRRLFEGAEREGLTTIRLYLRQPLLFWGVDWWALDIFGQPYGVREVTTNGNPPYEADLRVTTWTDDSHLVGENGLARPCGRIDEGEGLVGGEPVTTSVLVERRSPRGFERWCEF